MRHIIKPMRDSAELTVRFLGGKGWVLNKLVLLRICSEIDQNGLIFLKGICTHQFRSGTITTFWMFSFRITERASLLASNASCGHCRHCGHWLAGNQYWSIVQMSYLYDMSISSTNFTNLMILPKICLALKLRRAIEDGLGKREAKAMAKEAPSCFQRMFSICRFSRVFSQERLP